MDLEKRIEQLEFQMELLFGNSKTERFIYESGLTRAEYKALMDLMDRYREKIDSKETISHSEFENEVYRLIPKIKGDYHFCELSTQLFAEDGRWTEVFTTLYGSMTKYGGTD